MNEKTFTILGQIESVIFDMKMHEEKDKDNYFLFVDPHDLEALRNFDEKIAGYEQTWKFIENVDLSETRNKKDILEKIIQSLKIDWLATAEKKGTLFSYSAKRVFLKLNDMAKKERNFLQWLLSKWKK